MKFKNFNFLLLPKLGAVLLGLLGVVLLIWPGFLTGFLPMLVGCVLLAGAVCLLSYYFIARREGATLAFALTGIATLLVALVLLFNPNLSSTFFAIVIGLYTMVISIGSIIAAFKNKLKGRDLLIDTIPNIFSAIWGVMLLVSPVSGHTLWARLLGGLFLLTAIFTFVRIHRFGQKLPKSIAFFHLQKNVVEKSAPAEQTNNKEQPRPSAE